MSLAGLLRCSFQGVKNKIAMCFRYGGTGEAEGEKLLSAISLIADVGFGWANLSRNISDLLRGIYKTFLIHRHYKGIQSKKICLN